MFDWLRLAAVFSRSRDLRPGADPRCTVDKDVRAGNGWKVDRFRAKQPTGAYLVLLHGWTLRGKDDLRLQAFARSLAIAGVECCVPTLPGLAMLTFDREDVAGLRALLDDSPSPPGIIGFSLGGGYALLAASGGPRQPRFLASVGGYGDLSATFHRSTEWGRQRPSDPTTKEAWVYQKLALAWRLREVVPLSAETRDELRSLLESFCEGHNVAAAWAFCQRVLGDTDWETEDERRQDAATLSALSVAEHPPELACPVVILHDKNDETVPPSEAQVVAEAVRRGSPGIRIEVMVTDLLQHVTPDLTWRPREVFHLLRLLSPLLRR
jgi:pimeloyl-ACP methyl ester carboxylesterase